MVKILNPKNNYFEIADQVYQSCLPILQAFVNGSQYERIAIRNLDAISYTICKTQLWQDWSKFLGPYYCMYRSQREYKTKLQQASFAPYWLYSCDCISCNHQHSNYNNLVLRYDDSCWNKYFPPNSWECGCSIRNLTEEQYKLGNYKSEKDMGIYFQLKPPFDINFALVDWSDIYKKLFIQHFAALLYENNNYSYNEDLE